MHFRVAVLPLEHVLGITLLGVAQYVYCAESIIRSGICKFLSTERSCSAETSKYVDRASCRCCRR
ncbi:hypothetical protein APHNP_1525 [Anaplasma phagocytophilum str. ApNP]|uniref:Uncharacterized protein n=1 Tax=Anaplasma phagocytophilum str. ApNP TaxID=1359153 RepID=A0A0F3NIA8_ANAPH|nr:hypothetical protein APHNP_1525 [Anaplasma phagocytophilum str. ApNP]